MSIKSHIFLDNSAKKQGNKQKTVLSTVGHENYLALKDFTLSTEDYQFRCDSI